MKKPPPKIRKVLSGPNREVNRLVEELGGLRGAVEYFQCSESSVRDSINAGRISAARALWVVHTGYDFDPLDLSPREEKVPKHLRAKP